MVMELVGEGRVKLGGTKLPRGAADSEAERRWPKDGLPLGCMGNFLTVRPVPMMEVSSLNPEKLGLLGVDGCACCCVGMEGRRLR